MIGNVVIVYSCCGVGSWGVLSDPCWSCGQPTGRDAWMDTHPDDYDGVMVRKSVSPTNLHVKRPVL